MAKQKEKKEQQREEKERLRKEEEKSRKVKLCHSKVAVGYETVRESECRLSWLWPQNKELRGFPALVNSKLVCLRLFGILNSCCCSVLLLCVTTGGPSSMYMYVYLYYTILCKSRNITICMGKTVFLKIQKKYLRFKIRNSLPCFSLVCSTDTHISSLGYLWCHLPCRKVPTGSRQVSMYPCNVSQKKKKKRQFPAMKRFRK